MSDGYDVAASSENETKVVKTTKNKTGQWRVSSMVELRHPQGLLHENTVYVYNGREK